MKLKVSKIAEFISATNHIPESVSAEVVQGYSIDSRTVGAGQLFFAVKGERLDGHDYVESSLQRGAVAAVVRADQLARFADQTRLDRRRRHAGRLTNLGDRGAQNVGQATGRRYRVCGKDDHERSHRSRSQPRRPAC